MCRLTSRNVLHHGGGCPAVDGWADDAHTQHAHNVDVLRAVTFFGAAVMFQIGVMYQAAVGGLLEGGGDGGEFRGGL